MATKRRISKPKLLSSTRPKLPGLKSPSLTSKATRTLIRNHHNFSKQRAKAIKDGDEITAAKLTKQIEAQGGIESYQRASLKGQSNDRGGDSSKLLMEWLSPLRSSVKPTGKQYFFSSRTPSFSKRYYDDSYNLVNPNAFFGLRNYIQYSNCSF